MRELLHDPERLTQKLDELIATSRNAETKEFWQAVKEFAVNASR
jgi:hypothetical protein